MVAAKYFEDEVSLEIRDGVALLTLVATEGSHPWGTLREEHRWNPLLIRALTSALDEVEVAGDQVNALVLANEGKFWSNGLDLKYLESHGVTIDSLGGQKSPVDGLTDLILRVLCFPVPTIAAFSGHWCAAGAMFGLAFDCRIMARLLGDADRIDEVQTAC